MYFCMHVDRISYTVLLFRVSDSDNKTSSSHTSSPHPPRQGRYRNEDKTKLSGMTIREIDQPRRTPYRQSVKSVGHKHFQVCTMQGPVVWKLAKVNHWPLSLLIRIYVFFYLHPSKAILPRFDRKIIFQFICRKNTGQTVLTYVRIKRIFKLPSCMKVASSITAKRTLKTYIVKSSNITGTEMDRAPKNLTVTVISDIFTQ